ncbi:MAG: ATP-dependent DNA helicase, partial [Betaproteobacteria bacterium]|nr:ATP-dependent DNA helicase [Betaproteobacteria bacterium]
MILTAIIKGVRRCCVNPIWLRADNLTMDLQEAFAEDGPLAAKTAGYRHRPQQLEMATRVADACQSQSIALLEAGPGTGKTFAYLVPLLGRGDVAVISTSTRSLQDQLFSRDLPALVAALSANVKVRMLKGRRNYLCKQRIEQAQQQGELAFESNSDRRIDSELAKIAAYEQRSEDGDIAGIEGVRQFSPVWKMVTSTAENCLQNECPHYDNCHVYRARRQAKEAQIVVVNHSVVISDMALRREGGAGLLPEKFSALVFDEAHELPDMLIAHLAEMIDTAALAQDAGELLASPQLAGEEQISKTIKAVGNAAQAVLASAPRDWPASLTMAEVAGQSGFMAALAVLRDCLQEVAELSEQLSATKELAARLKTFVGGRAALLERVVDAPQTGMNWLENGRERIIIKSAPADIEQLFADQILAKRTVVFASAALATAGSFAPFCRRLGIDEASACTGQWESPFDFQRNSQLLLPADMPQPNSEDFAHKVIEIATDLCQASDGRAFLLLSTRRAMHHAGKSLRNRLGKRYQVLVQGEAHTARLLERFTADAGRMKVLV